MRDMRDPIELGHKLLAARESVSSCFGLSRIADHVPLHASDYSSDRLSSDPATHHSKTSQSLGDLSDGGA